MFLDSPANFLSFKLSAVFLPRTILAADFFRECSARQTITYNWNLFFIHIFIARGNGSHLICIYIFRSYESRDVVSVRFCFLQNGYSYFECTFCFLIFDLCFFLISWFFYIFFPPFPPADLDQETRGKPESFAQMVEAWSEPRSSNPPASCEPGWHLLTRKKLKVKATHLEPLFDQQLKHIWTVITVLRKYTTRRFSDTSVWQHGKEKQPKGYAFASLTF